LKICYLGILGGGNISDTHARAAAGVAAVRVSAVYGQNVERSAQLADRAGAVAYADLDRFLDHKPMDFVAIGSPSGFHAEQAMAAISRGLHVIVEKPLDISTARIDTLIAAADRAGVRIGVFFQDRLKPDVLRMKEMVDSGHLGTPILASGRIKWHRPDEYFAGSRWRGTWALDGGGALMNQGIHTIDVLSWMFGRVARVSAFAATRVHPIEVEDTLTATLEFENGALGGVEASTCAYPGYPRRVELTGRDGTLILEGDSLIATDLRDGSQRPTPPPTREESDRASARLRQQSAQSATVGDAAPHQRMIEDFVNAIATNGTPACDAREGRRSVEIVEAIYRSARERRWVEVAERPTPSPDRRV
jgi:UDP-N-acetyl-2-amino-2-deoxyglucuronate dehydrogenase